MWGTGKRIYTLKIFCFITGNDVLVLNKTCYQLLHFIRWVAYTNDLDQEHAVKTSLTPALAEMSFLQQKGASGGEDV